MTDQQEMKEAITAPALPVQTIPIPDARPLSEAVLELNISQKNAGIHPSGPVRITKSIDRVRRILQNLFEPVRFNARFVKDFFVVSAIRCLHENSRHR